MLGGNSLIIAHQTFLMKGWAKQEHVLSILHELWFILTNGMISKITTAVILKILKF